MLPAAGQNRIIELPGDREIDVLLREQLQLDRRIAEPQSLLARIVLDLVDIARTEPALPHENGAYGAAALEGWGCRGAGDRLGRGSGFHHMVRCDPSDYEVRGLIVSRRCGVNVRRVSALVSGILPINGMPSSGAISSL